MDLHPSTERFAEKDVKTLQNLDFSPEEVRALLREGELEALYDKKLSQLQISGLTHGIYNSTEERKRNISHLKKILEGKHEAYETLVYFKQLEETFLSKVGKTVKGMQQDTRGQMAAVSGHVQDILQNLDEDALKKIRLADPEDLAKGINLPDGKTIRAYVDLVREEVKSQVSVVKTMAEPEKNPGLWRRLLKKRPGQKAKESPEERELREDRLADLLEKATFLVDFFADHFSREPRKRQYLRAMLLRSISAGQREKNIEELYQKLAEVMTGKASVAEVKKGIEGMVTELEKGAELDRSAHLREILEHFAHDLNITEEEAEKIMTEQALTEDDEPKTYEEAIASHLSEIESARLHLEMMQLAPDETFAEDILNAEEAIRFETRYRTGNDKVGQAYVSGDLSGLTRKEKRMIEEMKEIARKARERTRSKRIGERKDLLASEVKGLRSVIEKYRDRASSIQGMIEGMPEEICDGKKKIKLQEAAEFLRKEQGRNETGIKIELRSIQDKEALDRFIAKAEKAAAATLEKKYRGTSDHSVEAADERTVELLQKNFPGFDALTMMKEREVYEYRSQDEYVQDNPKDPSDRPLSDVREELKRMKEISDQGYREGGRDMKDFEHAEKAIQKILNAQTVGEGSEKRIKKLPPAEYELWTALIHEKRNREIYARTLDAFHDVDDVENLNDQALRAALEALYKDRFLRSPEKQNLAKKFSKIMMLDHAITMIRFSAADNKPMESHGQFQMHEDEHGKPMTFKARSKALVKRAKSAIKENNFLTLDALFDDYEIGERLYTNALFFPVTYVQNPALLEGVLYQANREPRNGKPTIVSMSVHPKIAHVLKYFSSKEREKYFSGYEKKGETDCGKALLANEAQYARDGEFLTLRSRIADDEEYQKAFSAQEQDKDLNRDIPNLGALEIKNEGGIRKVFQNGRELSNQEMFAALQKAENEAAARRGNKPVDVKAMMVDEAGPEADEMRVAELSKARLEQLQKESPLIAARAAQWKSELMGRIHGGAQHAVRYITYDANLAVKTATGLVSEFMNSLTFYSPMHVYLGVFEFIQNWEQRFDQTTKFWTYNLLHEMFKGTIVGSEFRKQMESAEHHRVTEFVDAMKHYGHQEVIEKLTHAQDMFEFKAALTEGYENRGVITDEHILTNDFINTLNKFHHHGHKIHCPYSDKQMADDPEIKIKMLEEIEKSIDAWWGRGTFQRWKTAGVSKNESYKKDAIDKMKSYLPDDKERIYKEMWERLKSDSEIDKMKREEHVGTIVGTIEQDMIEGKFDTGITYALLQGFICAGIIKKEHVGRLQFEHANDFPIYSILTPQQAQLSGLTDYWKANRHKELSHALSAGNDFCRFFQGEKALPLKVRPDNGKWRVPTSQKEFDDRKAKGEIQEVAITAHQLQKYREAQEEFYKRMDNSCIGLFLPAYNWSQIKAALRLDISGNMEKARSHDIVAAYRGIHTVFTAHMQAMNDRDRFKGLDDPLQFMRSVWFAYDAICKTSAFASHLASMKGRTKDNKVNQFDASPNFDEKYIETKPGDGISNFEKMILTNEGGSQRMLESQATLDSGETGLSDELRREFKLMAGFQHVRVLGVGPDGKKNTNPPYYTNYDRINFDPQGKFKDVIRAFVKHVGKLADERGIGAQIRQWLGDGERNFGESQISNFTQGANNVRMEAMARWYNGLKMS